MDQYVVYKIEYKGKVKYIGKASNFNQRKWQHINYQGRTKSAIPKYADIKKIKIEPIASYSTKVEMQAAEEYYIRYYNTLDKGWNKIHSKILDTDKPKKEKVDDDNNDQTPGEFLHYEKHFRSIMKEVS